jgi:acetyl esterase/lipase
MVGEDSAVACAGLIAMVRSRSMRVRLTRVISTIVTFTRVLSTRVLSTRVRLLAAGAVLALCASHAQAQIPFAAVDDSSRAAPAADARIAYGAGPSQFIELRVPQSGRAPFPVVMLLHGGCWRAAYSLAHLAGAAESLRRAGYATWTPEYRRVGEEGGGVPGTFDDIRAAYDSLVAQAPSRGLDPARITLMGHSAGGHLALWLASEPAVTVRGVIALAAITDLVAFVAPTGCGAAVPLLMGGAPTERADQYAVFSPVTRRAPPAAVVVLVANDDRTVPASQSERYIAQVPSAQTRRVAGGHFDLVAPWSEAWREVLSVLRAMTP